MLIVNEVCWSIRSFGYSIQSIQVDFLMLNIAQLFRDVSF
jgi:hypothetical protein